jgi:2-desacetyl-2-hydroxyethyl bacteriochlorophyllide A dehydrogenase
MQALQLVAHGKPGKFALQEVPDPAPAADEVVVAVKACGLNHLDLWVEEAGLPIPITLPRTPGGEVAGDILSLGADVDQWQVGDRVAVQSNLYCGACEPCRSGEEAVCLQGTLLGVDRDGGFAGRVVVPARSLVRLPEAVSYQASAALTLAGSTAMHMLVDRAQVHEGDWVLVMGASSGVGSAAIQIARRLGARVISTASDDRKRILAARLGAEHVVDLAEDDWPAQVRKITGKRGVDLVIEHVGGEVLEKSFQCLARGGTVVTCGATTGREVRLNIWPLFVKQQRLVGSYGRNRSDLTAALDWAARGKLKPVIDAVHPLAQAPEAFARLRSRDVLGKLVIEP